MALVQDAHINMPFQSWELRPRGINHVLFTIIAAIVEVEIEIKVQFLPMTMQQLPLLPGRPLLSPAARRPTGAEPHFAPVAQRQGADKQAAKGRHQPLPCARLQQIRQHSEQGEIVLTTLMMTSWRVFQNSITEERLYQQMALVCSGMAFSWSKWNNEVGDTERVIVQVGTGVAMATRAAAVPGQRAPEGRSAARGGLVSADGDEEAGDEVEDDRV